MKTGRTFTTLHPSSHTILHTILQRWLFVLTFSLFLLATAFAVWPKQTDVATLSSIQSLAGPVDSRGNGG